MYSPLRPAPPVLTNLQKANTLLQNLTNEFHAVLSFNFRTPIGSPNYDQLQAQWNSSMLRTDFAKNRLEVDTVTKWIFFLETFKANSRRGCQTSLLSNISPAMLTAIKTSLLRQFPADLGLYADLVYDAIPEDLFVEFLLLRMNKVEETDKEDMSAEFHKIKMQSFITFDYTEYRSFVGRFLRLREMLRPHLSSWSNKRWAELFRDGLSGSLLFDKAKRTYQRCFGSRI